MLLSAALANVSWAASFVFIAVKDAAMKAVRLNDAAEVSLTCRTEKHWKGKRNLGWWAAVVGHQ